MIRPRLFGKLPSRRCLIPWNIQSSIHNSATNSAKVLRKHLLDSRCAIRRCKTPENQIQRSAWWAQAERRRWTQRELEPSHLASLYLNFDTPSQSELPRRMACAKISKAKKVSNCQVLTTLAIHWWKGFPSFWPSSCAFVAPPDISERTQTPSSFFASS